MKRLTELVKYFLALALVQLLTIAAFAQSGQLGPSIICAGAEYAYTQSDATAVGISWDIVGGSFTSATNTRNVTVIWNSTATQRTISCTYSVKSGVGNSLSDPMTVTQSVDLLTAGTISQPGASGCGSASGSLSLSGYNGGIIQWESSPDQSSWTVVAGATSTYSYSITGTTYYRVRVTANNCVLYATRTVPVNGASPAPGVTNVTVCASTAATFTATGAPTGYQYRWYDAGGTLIQGQTGNTYTTAPLTSGTTCRVSIINPSTGCESASVAVTATVVDVAKPVLVPGTPPCGSGAISLSTATPGTVKWYTTPPTAQTTPVFTGAAYTPVISTTTTFYATATGSGGCVSQTSSITVAPTIISAGVLTNTETGSCNPKTGQLVLSGYSGTIARWESSVDHSNWTTIAMPGGVTAYYNYSVTQAMYFRAIVTNSNCIKTSDSVLITPPPVVQAPMAGMQVRCGSGPVTLAAVDPSANPANSFRWYSAASVLLATTQTGSYVTPSLSAGTTYRVSLVNNGCEGPRVDMNVVIDNNCSIIGGNYVTTTTVLKEGVQDPALVPALTISDVSREINYFDGFGRSIQQVNVQASPSKKDIVDFTEYDAFGRSSRNYLPYTEGNTGAFKTAARTNQAAFYLPANARIYKIDSTTKPFAETVYEASVIGRELEHGAAGEDWQLGAGHTTTTTEAPLSASEPYGVPVFEYNFDTKVITSSASYQPGDLLKKQTKDEQGTVTTIYLDKRGLMVAKAITGVNNSSAYTYNVYDAFGYLRAVIPPQGALELMNTSGSWTLSATFIDKWCFTYDYDQWGRQVEKKTPGAQPFYTVYNSKDQSVMAQDGEMRKKGQWVFYKYDALGRMVLSGLYTSTTGVARSIMQDSVTAVTQTFETRTGSNFSTQHGYTITKSFPVLSSPNLYEVLSVNYYDDYDYDFNYLSINASFTALGRGTDPVPCYRMAGQATGNKHKVLGSSPAKFLANTLFYDDKGSIIQTISGNILDRQDITTTRTDFTGKIVESVQYHSDAGNELYIRKQYTYDHAGRMLNMTHQVERNSVLQTAVTMSATSYNELGQTAQKKLHSTDQVNYLQAVNYTYNIRGWLTAINDADLSDATDLFGEEIRYNTALQRPFNAAKRYDGNISEIWWKDRYSNKYQGYAYSYDWMNRMLSARYAAKSGSTWTEADGNNETVAYDLNGNITGLSRYQWPAGASAPQAIDMLSYTHTGNQLKKVEDNAGTYASAGFVNGSVDPEEYLYDANGNTTTDKNKGIASIRYNVLNLPEEITMTGKGKIVYSYDAAGAKLSKQVVPLTGSTVTSEYAGDFEYTNGVVQYLATDEGRVVFTSSAINYEYALKDHMGNPRVYFDRNPANGAARIIQKTDYYPFGMTLTGNYISGTENKYQYNSKELQSELGLNLYDYGARFYDPQLARWAVIDPKAKDFSSVSPYVYCLNNPVKLVDPDGEAPVDQIDQVDPRPRPPIFSRNARTFGFFLAHPILATSIGRMSSGSTNISTNAVRFSTRLGLRENSEHEGSEVNAFRHTLWQSTITAQYGRRIAEQVGNAHEDNPNLSPNRTFTGKDAMAQADQTIDLLNNQIGRQIGSANQGAGMKALAEATLDYQYGTGLYTATKNKDGSVTVSQTKITESQYQQGQQIIRGLNNNGFTASEQNKRNEAERQRQQTQRMADDLNRNGPKF